MRNNMNKLPAACTALGLMLGASGCGQNNEIEDIKLPQGAIVTESQYVPEGRYVQVNIEGIAQGDVTDDMCGKREGITIKSSEWPGGGSCFVPDASKGDEDSIAQIYRSAAGVSLGGAGVEFVDGAATDEPQEGATAYESVPNDGQNEVLGRYAPAE